MAVPTPEELAMQSADQIFIEGIWEEPDLPNSESIHECPDSNSHRAQDGNEVTFESKIRDAMST